MSNAELATRSSIGFFRFLPAGCNEQRVREAGVELVRSADLTEAMESSEGRRHGAKARRRVALGVLEGEASSLGLRSFLDAVERLARERKLSRNALPCERPREGA